MVNSKKKRYIDFSKLDNNILNMNPINCITLILTLFTVTIFSQGLDTDRLNVYFDSLEKYNKFMGSVSLLIGDNIVYTKQSGYSDVGSLIRPNDSTKYRIGSISKTFTATLIFQAIDDNKLTLDKSINKWFPKIENSKNITIENLLNHSSGIHNFTNDIEYQSYYTQFKSEKEMLEIISKAGSDFEPGSIAVYSNSNYVLLSYILEKIYKKSYSQLLNDQILDNLDLTNTFYGQEIKPDNNECYSYSLYEEWEKQPETDLSIPMGAGAIVSTPTELNLFAKALFNGELISKKSLEKMKRISSGFGMGIFKIPFQNHTSFGHNGGIDGFSSSFGYFPKEKYGFSLISNGSNYDNNKIVLTLLKCLFKEPFEIPAFVLLTSNQLNEYIGVYSSSEFPLKITISKKGASLKAQATGQGEIPLEPTEQHVFTFDPASIEMKFNPLNNEMTLKQGAGEYILKKE